MTDSLSSRVARLIAGGALALMDRVEGTMPATLLEQTGREVDQLTDEVRATIARQIDIEAQLPVLETSLTDKAPKERDLSGYVDALLSKRREMDIAIRDFEAACHPAQAPSQDAPSGNPLVQHPQGAFDHMNQHHAGLEQAASLRELARDNKINERFAALKAGHP
jgi:phage shock protein A